MDTPPSGYQQATAPQLKVGLCAGPLSILWDSVQHEPVQPEVYRLNCCECLCAMAWLWPGHAVPL